jgi:hypothetical protein
MRHKLACLRSRIEDSVIWACWLLGYLQTSRSLRR